MTNATNHVLLNRTASGADGTGAPTISSGASSAGHPATFLSKTELRGDLRSTRDELLELSAALPDAALRQRPAPEDWSLLEIIVHVIHVDHYNLAFALAIRDDPNQQFAPFDPEDWITEHRSWVRKPSAMIMDALAESHRRVLDTLNQITSEELHRAGRRRDGRPVTVRDVFQLNVHHDRNHICQMAYVRDRLMI